MIQFVGFTYMGVHSSRFNVSSISNGNGYSKNLFAEHVDNTFEVDGMDGTYYTGTRLTNKRRNLRMFVDSADENMLRDIKRWLAPRNIGKLTFDESPYKYYIAKVSNTPNLEFKPQSDSSGGFVYSGYFNIEFVAYNPFAYSYVKSTDTFDYYEGVGELWNYNLYYDSGILYTEEMPLSTLENITSPINFNLYNGGSNKTKPIITVQGNADELTLKNITTGQQFTLKNLTNNITMIVDCQKGQVRVGDTLASSYHEGGYIEIDGTDRVIGYDEVGFANGSNTIIVEGVVDFSIVGRFIAVDNDWYKVIDCNFDNGLITLDRPFEGLTEEYSLSVLDLNEFILTGVNLDLTKIEFEYRYCYL